MGFIRARARARARAKYYIPAVLLGILAIALPSRLFIFEPESNYVGPLNYDSQQGNESVFIGSAGLDAMPKYFKMKATFLLRSHPTKGTRQIFSTSTPDRGLSFYLDSKGDLYLSIGGTLDPTDPHTNAVQLVRVFKRTETGREMVVEVRFRKATNEFSVLIDGESRVLEQVGTGRIPVNIQRIVPDFSIITLGSAPKTSFDGIISDFMISSSLEDSRGETNKLRIVLALMSGAFLMFGFIYSRSTVRTETVG